MTERPSPSSRAVLMLRPHAFGFNRDTAASNTFQRDDGALEAAEIGRRARAEFEGLAAALRAHGIRVVCIDDTPAPAKPDAVFPNNWLSLHAEGDAVLYPMLAPSRQAEARLDVLDLLAAEHGLRWPRVHDLRDPARLGGVLEGTGSLVLDRRARIAYASLSPRTEAEAVRAFCTRFGYEPVVFRAADTAGVPVYHTNVVMALGADFAIVCLDAVADTDERRRLVARLEATGHEPIPITPAQMTGFAGNVLELGNETGARIVVGSDAALAALGEAPCARLGARCTLVSAPLPTIERYGGGSARCMLVEIEAPGG